MAAPLEFRDPKGFLGDTAAVVVAATVGGAAMTVLAPRFGPSLGIPLSLAIWAPAAALLAGAAIAGARRQRGWRGILLGALTGVVAAGGYVFLGTASVLSGLALALGGALGGVGLAAFLVDPNASPRAALRGAVAALAAGGTGGVAALQVSRFAEASQWNPLFTGAGLAGAFALWTAAGGGLHRVARKEHPLLMRAAALRPRLTMELRSVFDDAERAFTESTGLLSAGSVAGAVTRDDAHEAAHALFEGVLDALDALIAYQTDAPSAALVRVEERLLEIQTRLAATDDAVTTGHLARAAQALNAQRSALKERARACERASAALAAHSALLERLRLAMQQAASGEVERFGLELNAIADQVDGLADDLSSLRTALDEVESLTDRRLLADIEHASRRALEVAEASPARRG